MILFLINVILRVILYYYFYLISLFSYFLLFYLLNISIVFLFSLNKNHYFIKKELTVHLLMKFPIKASL